MTEKQKSLNLDMKEAFEFEPIRGFPTLQWRGKRPFTSTQYYPAQLKEVYGSEDNGWRNKLYWGDNLQVLSHLLKEFRGTVDLVYIDPPFDSRAEYKKKIMLRGKTASSDSSSFEEKQYSDIWLNDEYLQFMYERLILIRELVSQNGLILLHADYHRGHHLRCLLDEVFGPGNFRNEIIVKRPITKNLQAQFETINSLSCAHDNLYLYVNNPKIRLQQAWDEQEIKSPNGYWHRFWSGEDRPTMRYKLLGVSIDSGQWKWEEDRANRAAESYEEFLAHCKKTRVDPDDEALRKYWEATGCEKEFLRRSSTTIENWFSPSDKKLANTLWLEVKAYENKKLYPTQKHTELISLIIERFSRPGDLVMDCFMGSGTTQLCAMNLGRRFLGADINLGAIEVAKKRLVEDGGNQLSIGSIGVQTKVATGFEVFNVNNYDLFRNPVQAKELLIEALEIQKFEHNSVYDGEKDGRLVKIMPINRIATRADLNELLAGFDYGAFDAKLAKSPNGSVEKIMLVCMGHEADLKAQLEVAVKPYKIDVEVVDILRDRENLEFRRDSQAKLKITKSELVVEKFYPMNLLQKLSLQKEEVKDWRELVESISIDWNFDGAVLQPTELDIPEGDSLVRGRYAVPDSSGTIRVKITDLLSESWEGTINA